MELSSVCMTPVMTVRRDQPPTRACLPKRTGWQRILESSLSGRVIWVPSGVNTVNSRLIRSAPLP